MWSTDEPGSLDDYEFASELGLRGPYRERKAFDAVEWHADTLQRKSKELLERVDRSGVWIVATTGGAILVSALDSLFVRGETDAVILAQLAPDWIPDLWLFDIPIDPATVASAETTLQSIFLFEFALRAWSERFNLTYLRSPVALVDLAAILPSLDSIGGAGATAALRPLRLFRLLRLLRLAGLGGLGAAQEDRAAARVTDKVTNVAVEFLCVFLIAGELFYDLEYDVNPNISDVGDALYWSFLTLTGIGQPFEAVTAAGRVATVGSILTALVVVPLQLANLVGQVNGDGGAERRDANANANADAGVRGNANAASGVGGVGMAKTMGVFRNDNRGETTIRGSGGGSRSSSGSDFDFDSESVEVGFERDWSGTTSSPARATETAGNAIRVGLGPSAEEEWTGAAAFASAFESFDEDPMDAVDRAYARETTGRATSAVIETKTRLGSGSGHGSRAVEEGMRAELAAARERIRAFEREVDALRDENARLRDAMRQTEARRGE
jgi:hypothetical protein